MKLNEPAFAFEEPPDEARHGRPAPNALGAQVRRGLAWKAASQATVQLSRTVMTVILARLLVPRDFGIAGMVLVFSGLITLLTDVGFSGSLIQEKTLSEEDRSTAFWTALFTGALLFGISVAIAPLIADFYGVPRVKWLFIAACSGFLTGGLATTQAALLWRSMDFKALEIRAILATIVSSAVGITAAFEGLGAWSLILQAVAMSATTTVAIWVMSPWRPSFRFSFTSLRRMGRFSSNVFFSRLVTYGDRNLDNLLVGRFIGPAALGIYSIGYSVIVIPFERLVWPIHNVFIPAFASLQNDLPKLRELWLRGIRLIATLMMPTMAGAIVATPDLVKVVLGTRWLPAIAIIQMLAWVALIQSLCTLNEGLYQSRNRSGLLLQVSVIAFAADATAFVVGLHWGIRGVAAAYAISNTVLVVPMGVVLSTRLLEVRITGLFRELRGVIEATVTMVAALIPLRMFLVDEHVPAAARLGATILAGALVYLLVCAWRDRRVFAELKPRRLKAPVTG